jgi:hypothetical protein
MNATIASSLCLECGIVWMIGKEPMMAHRPIPAWQRTLHKMATNLVDGIRNIFGPSDAVAYRPPDPEPKRNDGPQQGEHGQMFRPSSGDDRLPPRERRGRD